MLKKILIVEDEDPLRQQYITAFRQAGFDPIAAKDKSQTLKILQREPFVVCVLDVNLSPKEPFGGTDLLQTIRQQYPKMVTFIVTGAAIDVVDQYRGLDKLQADDYIVKPIDPRVLAAKVTAVLRRHELLKQPSFVRYYCFDKLQIDFLNEVVNYLDRSLPIGSVERTIILRTLADAQGQVVPYPKLWEVWRGNNSQLVGEPEPEAIQKFTYTINDRLKQAGFNQNLIKTVRGTGMKIPPSDCAE